MGVTGPMARKVADLALLLSVQAGYDPRAPLSMEGEGSVFRARSKRSLKGKRIAWVGDFKGYTPYEPGVLEVCQSGSQDVRDASAAWWKRRSRTIRSMRSGGP